MRTCGALMLSFLILSGASWIDPHATAREAAKLYTAGNFNGASAKYNEALVEDPDSTLLHYNLGASVYREGKYEEAVTAYGQTPTADVRKVAYNVGNATYRLGVETEASDPEKALSLYAAAVAAYRRAMGDDPNDEDAKFNHEFVTRKIAELQKKLEEEKKKQEEQKEQQQDQQDQQQQKDEQKDQQEQGEQDQQEQQKQQADQQNPQDQQAQQAQQDQQDRQDQQEGGQPEDTQQQPQQPEQQGEQQAEQAQGQQGQPADGEPGSEQPGGEAVASDQPGEMTEREAQALLDAARDQEARPDEVAKRMQRARVLEPAEDW